MAKRVVRVGVMTYLNEAKVPVFAMLGAEVDVHADDVERFDRLNVGPEPNGVPEPEDYPEPEPEKKTVRRR